MGSVPEHGAHSLTEVEKTTRTERGMAYARRADPIMAWLAMLFLIVFTGVVVWTEMPSWMRIVCAVIQVVIWVVFFTDLMVRVSLADRRVRWLLTHPLDVLAVLWPAFRPLKILAVIGDRRFRADKAVVRTTRAVVVASVLLIWVCSVAVLAAERGQVGSSIENIGDAVWWAFVTIATVGYGDMVPVTAAGRAIGIVLMIVGIAMVGIITASIASWFVASQRGEADQDDQNRDDEHRARILALEAKIDKLLAAEADRDERRG